MSRSTHKNTHEHASNSKIAMVKVNVADPDDKSKTMEVQITRRQLHKGGQRGYIIVDGVKHKVKKQSYFEDVNLPRMPWAKVPKTKDEEDKDKPSRSRKRSRRQRDQEDVADAKEQKKIKVRKVRRAA
jgi:hypothetical protein